MTEFETATLSVNKGLTHIGDGVYVNPSKIVATMRLDSAPVRRLVATAKEQNLLADGTYGQKTEAIILFDNHLVLSTAKTSDEVASILDESEESE